MYFQSKKLLGTWLVIALYLPIAFVLFAEFQKYSGNLIDFFTLSNVLAAFVVFGCIGFGLMLTYTLEISDESIEYRFFPIQLRTRKLAWSDVQTAQLVQFKALSQFWGYGLRKNPNYGTAYIIGGSVGLYIITRDGQKLLFEISDVKKLRELAKEEGLHKINFDLMPLETMDITAFQVS